MCCQNEPIKKLLVEVCQHIGFDQHLFLPKMMMVTTKKVGKGRILSKDDSEVCANYFSKIEKHKMESLTNFGSDRLELVGKGLEQVM